jgi:glycogen debranching enzyme
VDGHGRTVRTVLRNIAEGYLRGTPNGIRVESESGLVWSPSHFTWMDTNYPAGTPREGYPVEIQILWIQLLRLLLRVDPGAAGLWSELAEKCRASLLRLYWLEAEGYLAKPPLRR